MKKKLSVAEFIRRIDHTKIAILLNLFSRQFRFALPEEIWKLSKPFIMLDLLEVEATEVVLPVVVRSSAWLADINFLSGQNLEICLHEDFWPVQERIELVGGLCEIDEGDLISPLMHYVEMSVGYWKENELECRICLSDRVHALLKETSFIQTEGRCVRIINLSDAYKALKIPFRVQE